MSASKAIQQRGFTLIELLVAIVLVTSLAILSWRGLDSIARAQTQTSQRADAVLTLQAGLLQWKMDLDAVTQTPLVKGLEWNGQVLRLTRRTSLPGEGLQVVAWTRRLDAGGQWLRWQSPALRTFVEWNDAWSRAMAWAQNPSTEDRTREVRLTPLEEWQIYYFRGDAWSNPLSSDADQPPVASTSGVASTTALPEADQTSAVGTTGVTSATALPGADQAPVVSTLDATSTGVPPVVVQTTVPEGIRLVMTLPVGFEIRGTITLDWVRPNLGGGKS